MGDDLPYVRLFGAADPCDATTAAESTLAEGKSLRSYAILSARANETLGSKLFPENAAAKPGFATRHDERCACHDWSRRGVDGTDGREQRAYGQHEHEQHEWVPESELDV